MNRGPHLSLAGLVLAAGASRRMATPKIAVRLEGETFIARVLDGLLAARLDPIVVVAAAGSEALLSALLLGRSVRVVVNPAPERGQLSSLKVGLKQILASAPEVDGVIVALVDHAAVAAATVAELVHAARENSAAILVPSYDGRRGHPVVFKRAVWDELLATPDADSARVVVRRHATRVHEVVVDDPGVVRDFDTREDLAAFRKRD